MVSEHVLVVELQRAIAGHGQVNRLDGGRAPVAI